jgi:hypothetical protein
VRGGGEEQAGAEPLMCVYKLVTAEVPTWGMREKLASRLIFDSLHGIYVNFSRQLWCSVDEWIDLTHEQLEQLENDAAAAGAASLQGSSPMASPPPPPPSTTPTTVQTMQIRAKL